jgi:outer membrane lipoprotein-sorting protein
MALATGCAVALPPPRETVRDDARRALDLALARWRALSDLRALADVTLEKGGERQRLTGVLLARTPGSVRFEALSPFGQPFLFVTVRDGRFIAYDAARNEARVGKADAETTARLLSLPVSPEDLVGLLAARLAPPDDLRQATLEPPDEGGPSLSVADALHERRVWMDMTTGTVSRLRIVGGRAEATATYLYDGDGTLTGFDVDAGGGYVTASVRYRSLTLNGGIEPGRFILALPKDAKIHAIH